MNIVIALDQLEVGGTEGQMTALSCALQRMGHAVTLVSLRPPPSRIPRPLEEFVELGGSLRVPTRKAVSTTWKGLGGPAWTLRQPRADLVYATMTRTMALAGLGRILGANPPLVMSRRSEAGAWNSELLVPRIRRWSATRADLIIANSHRIARISAAAEGIPTDKIAVVHNGVPQEIRARILSHDRLPIGRGNAVRLLSVANLRPEKGHKYLLGAVAQLKKMGISAGLTIVGEGRERSSIVSQANNLGITVNLVGHQEDVVPFLMNASIFVQSSIHEGFPNALLEAMTAGCAIVATDVGGTAEALGSSGMLVPRASAFALANAISVLVRSPVLLEHKAAQARLRSKAFTMELVAEQHVDLFDSLLRRRAHS